MKATVISPMTPECPGIGAAGAAAGGPDCTSVLLHIDDGPDVGTTQRLQLGVGPGNPVVEVGDRLVVGRQVDAVGATTFYAFADFQRTNGLLLLSGTFVALVLFVARWKGLGAIVGLISTWLVVTQFLVPAILDGKPAVAAAVVASAAIVFVVLYIAHGFNAKTTTAVIGTLMSLALVGVLSEMSVGLTNLTGLVSEESAFVQQFGGPDLNLISLLVAAFVVGSIGVLNDTTVTQASAVWEIHLAQPDRTIRELYLSGMRVGRDHIASTVYTLVLAYTGAALPLLIIFELSGRRTADVLTGEIVADEIVRTLVGAIGLIASVPITTALAAWVASAQKTTVPHSGARASSGVETGITTNQTPDNELNRRSPTRSLQQPLRKSSHDSTQRSYGKKRSPGED